MTGRLTPVARPRAIYKEVSIRKPIREASVVDKTYLGGNVDVGNVLVLSEKRQVEDNGQRVGIGGQDNQL